MIFLFGLLYVHPIISVSRQERAVAAEQFANLPSSSAIQPSTTFLEKKTFTTNLGFCSQKHAQYGHIHTCHFIFHQGKQMQLIWIWIVTNCKALSKSSTTGFSGLFLLDLVFSFYRSSHECLMFLPQFRFLCICLHLNPAFPHLYSSGWWGGGLPVRQWSKWKPVLRHVECFYS